MLGAPQDESRTAGPDSRCPVLDLSGRLSLGRDPRSASEITASARSFLEGAAARGESHVVVVTSAIVYGAWENNPVPLEETRTLRPRPELPEAVALASVEAMVDQWRREDAGRSATVLRPVTVVGRAADGARDPMTRALARVLWRTRSHTPAPAQFLDAADLESAVELCRTARPDAVLDVAPPGMISGERLRELAPGSWQLPLPAAAADAVEGWLAALEVGAGAVAHVRHPWVVSGDRLAALGWQAAVSNEQAFVAGTTQGWFASLSAKRRQELALGASVAATLAAAVAAVSWLRRARTR